MELKRLKSDVISKIRSSFTINTVARCVFELVSNSLDSKSTSIAVRINLITFKVQVADNGEGVTKENLELLGIRYMTNKCHNLLQLEKHLSTYGFRGEALASIAEMCKSVSISSRYRTCSQTYRKTLSRNLRSEVKPTKHRASVGTTVTVLGFLSNFPVRQKRVIPEIELEEVKKCLTNLVIINPGTSFSLRNDVTGLLMLNSPKSSDIIGSFRHLHPDITDSFTLLKVSKNKVSVDALIHKEFIVSKKFQYVYVNKRPFLSHRILKTLNSSFRKKMQLKTKRFKHPIFDTRRYPIYVLNIRCPESYVDVCMGPTKSNVEFKCWDLVLACTEKIVKAFFGLDDKKENKGLLAKTGNARISCGVSQVLGAVQACAYKRKSDETTDDGEDNVKMCNNDDVAQNSLQSKPVCVKKSKLARSKQQKRHVESFVKDKTDVSPIPECSGNYQIEDSGKQEPVLKPRKLKSIIKKPLLIRVETKAYDLEAKLHNRSIFERETTRKSNRPSCFDLTKGKEAFLDRQLIPENQFDQKSVYSRLNTEEDQGKNLIMDMFLKSTQVFTGQRESNFGGKTCPNLSGETIGESNFVMENNIQDTVRGINTTMSISVNVKKKRIKNCDSKVSKCVQTSIVDRQLDQLTSKCEQTSQKHFRLKTNVSDLTHQFDGFQLSHDVNGDLKDNYTILINTIRKRRNFRFVRKSEEMVIDGSEEEQSFRPLKICRCRENDGNIFNFDQRGMESAQNSALKDHFFEKPCRPNVIEKGTNSKCFINKEDSAAIFKIPLAPSITEPKLRVQNQICDNKIRNNLHFRGIRKQSGPKMVQNTNLGERSPYFGAKTVQRQSPFTNNDLEQRIDCIQPVYTDFQQGFKSSRFRQNRFQENNFDNHLTTARNNVVSSPYFVGNCKKDEVYFADRIEDANFRLQNVNNQLQNCINESFSIRNSKLLHPKDHSVPGYSNFGQNCFKTHLMKNGLVHQNMSHTEPNDNCCRLPNTNLVPHFCCHDNVCRTKQYPEIDHQCLGMARNNDFERQNCYRQAFNCCKGNVWRNDYRNLTVEPRAERNFAKNTFYEIPGRELDDFNVKNLETTVPPVENENKIGLEAPWYTPNVSDENMCFGRTLSEPEEIKRDKRATVFADVQNKSTSLIAAATEDKQPKIDEGKNKFNFKFSYSPDIFSSNAVGEAERNPEINKTIDIFAGNETSNEVGDLFGALEKNDFEKAVRKDVFHESNLASYGVMRSNKLTNTDCPSKEGSDLEITLLDYQEKQDAIERELGDARKSNKNRFFSCESELQMVETKENVEKGNEKSRIFVDSQNEWVRKFNEAGRGFFVNIRTGMVYFATPKIDGGVFCFDRRLDFVPKGMSPVLKEHKKIDRSLSQNAKGKLHEFILESYENELMVIKWQNFIYNDPKTFFEEIYKEKSKQFENGIPSIQDGTLRNKLGKDIVGFSTKMFKTIEVIGQVDKKFIAVLEKNKEMVLLFDQHAVHERIRVEQFLKEYKGARTPCKEKLIFFMPRNDMSLLKNHSAYLGSLGLDVEFFTDGLKILNIPLCLQEKFYSRDNCEDLSKIINTLIKDLIESLKETRGSASQLPKVILNVINLKACRGAIKFGDSLTKEDCIRLLNDLAKCNLPFQCAHGRPTLSPVLRLSKIELKKKKEIDLKKLLRGN